MKTKGVIFDLGEVILRGLYGVERVISDMFDIKLAEDIFFNSPESNLFFKGKITERQYWQATINRHKLPLTVSQLKYCVRLNFVEIKGTRAVIERLKKQNYALGLLSIHGKEWVKNLEDRFKYHRMFDATCYSFENGLCKPDPNAYLAILNKLNLEPRECVFVDDGKVNVQAAVDLGMRGIQFTNAAELESQFQKFNLI